MVGDLELVPELQLEHAAAVIVAAVEWSWVAEVEVGVAFRDSQV